MIKVITHGYKKYRTTCYNCRCYFEYELTDISKGVVVCPDCGDMCSHNASINHGFTSEIDDDENEEFTPKQLLKNNQEET